MRKIFTSALLEEIWDLFALESRNNLLVAEQCLMTLEKDPGNPALIKSLVIAMASFKDEALVMGLPVVGSLAHQAQELIALVQDGMSFEKETIDLLLIVLNRLRTMLDYVLTHRQDVEPSRVGSLSVSLFEMISRTSMDRLSLPTMGVKRGITVSTRGTNRTPCHSHKLSN